MIAILNIDNIFTGIVKNTIRHSCKKKRGSVSIDWDCHDWLKRVAFGTLRKMGYTYLAYHTLSESWGTLSRQDKFIEKEKITSK